MDPLYASDFFSHELKTGIFRLGMKFLIDENYTNYSLEGPGLCQISVLRAMDIMGSLQRPYF
jgi:hypothetical protein